MWKININNEINLRPTVPTKGKKKKNPWLKINWRRWSTKKIDWIGKKSDRKNSEHSADT